LVDLDPSIEEDGSSEYGFKEEEINAPRYEDISPRSQLLKPTLSSN